MRHWILPVLLLGVAGCKPAAKTAAAPPPPPKVATVVIQPHDVGLTYAYGGRVTAYRQVEVRDRVGGILQQCNFIEGARVRAGDLLFQVDPAPYQAAVARAAAQVQQQVAQKEKAERDVRRTTTLLATQAGTVQAHDDAVSAVALANAQLAAAQADLRTQVLSLSYTTVTAPIGGATSLQIVPEGSLVGTATDNSLLTRITQTDPIYVTFSFDSDDLAQVRALAGREARFTARVVTDGSAMDGQVDFTDSSIDQATGTVRGRALFANGDDRLLPGAFVRVTLGGVVLHHALTVIKTAVGQDEAGAFVYVVEHGRSRRADIKLGPESGEDWVVTGLRQGDAAVMAGFIAYARSLPAPRIGDLVSRAEPLDEGCAFRFPASLRRRWERLARLPDGFVVVGDGICSFNPVFGQGMTVAAQESAALAAALTGPHSGLARRFYQAAARLVDRPWAIAAGMDLQHPDAIGRRGVLTGMVNGYMNRLGRAAQRDPLVATRLYEALNLMIPATGLFRPDIVTRTLRHGGRPAG